MPCSAGVRFLPGLKAGASSEVSGEKEKMADLWRRFKGWRLRVIWDLDN